MTLFDEIWRELISTWIAAYGPINHTDVGAAVSAFGFFSGFLSYVLASIASRKAYIRIERSVTIVIGVQALSILLGITDLATQLKILDWYNILFKLSLVIWALSLLPLYVLLDKVITIDRMKFNKPSKLRYGLPWKRSTTSWPPFKQFQDVKATPRWIRRFGVSCIDHYFDLATRKENRLFFPILLVAPKYFRPWRICHRFAASGLRDNEQVVLFSFGQPPIVILTQLAEQFALLSGAREKNSRPWWEKNQGLMRQFEHLYIIDCCSSWIGSQEPPDSGKPSEKIDKLIEVKILNLLRNKKNIFRSDPRDPVSLASSYEKALSKLILDAAKSPPIKGKQPAQAPFVRVVYDSISDLIQYGDPQLTMQFIKHNMVWEDLNRANSLYLCVPDMPSPNSSVMADMEFLRWNSYCEIDFKYQNGRTRMRIATLFSDTKETPIEVQPNDYVRKPSMAVRGLALLVKHNHARKKPVR